MRNVIDPSSEKPLAGLEVYYDEFRSSRLIELTALKNFLEASDWLGVMELAHKWKGFSAPYGFGQLGHLAAELEDNARNAHNESCQRIFEEIVEYLDSKKKS